MSVPDFGSAFAEDLVAFSTSPHDMVEDLVGDPIGADLRVLFAGNQFMALPDLFASFSAALDPAPAVFWETLPPGIVVRQVRAGGLVMGSLQLRFVPDVVAASPGALTELQADGLVGPPQRYASNDLCLLVRAGNPWRIRGWRDLLARDVRVAFPDPETEGIGGLALAAIEQTGGAELRDRIFEGKRGDGGLRLTAIHHRQGPRWLLDGDVEVAIVWRTEARHHLGLAAPFEEVVLPDPENRVGDYAVAALHGAPHSELAAAFVSYLAGPVGRAVFAAYGFAAPTR